jgi:hypothetical protein
MSQATGHDPVVDSDDRDAPWRLGRAVSTETKHSFKTTELPIYILAVLGVLVAAAVSVGFGAQEAWQYVTWLTVGYLLSRGLAKSGSREYADADRSG